MTATITNIINESTNIKVFVLLSNGQERVYAYDADTVNKTQIQKSIKEELTALENIELEQQKAIDRAAKKAVLLQELQGKVIS